MPFPRGPSGRHPRTSTRPTHAAGRRRCLDDLAAVVFEATEELVPVTHPQPFQADLVLARGRVPRELASRPVAGSWTARSVSLVADRSSPRGVRLEDLASFPLEG